MTASKRFLDLGAHCSIRQKGLRTAIRCAVYEGPQRADHDAALAKFASILRHKPRPLTKSQPPEFNKNPELISKE